MIARLWRGVARDRHNAEAYLRHLDADVIPALKAIQGHRDLRVLRRDEGGRVEFRVITSWDSMDAMRRFAGDKPERAAVER